MADLDSKVPRVCKVPVKDATGKTGPCGFRLPKGTPECKNKSQHAVNLSGFCGIGSHEGSKKMGANNKPLKSCSFWKTCPCECHKMFDQMYAMSGMPRKVVDNSEYETPINRFKVPTLEERAVLHASSIAPANVAPVILESPLPDRVPTVLHRTYAPTPTGRSARGELESWVRSVCDEYLVEQYRAPCTPGFISESIGKAQGVNPPSLGAVDAVLKRWVALGFAETATKPSRFVGYTPEGVRLGLDAMKLQAKQLRHSKVSAANRGVRTVMG